MKYRRHYYEKAHMLIHIIFGVLVGVTFARMYDHSTLSFVLVGIFFSLLPDIDHLLYNYVYGRSSAYSKKVRGFFKKKDVKGYFDFCVKNHKQNHYLYSHTFLPVISLFGFALYLPLTSERLVISVAVISLAIHFLFDIVDDLILLKKVNKNWWWPIKK